MLQIPISPVPSQTFQVVLNEQDCDIELITRGERLYMNLSVDGEPIQNGAVILNGISIIQMPTSRFTGNLVMVDTLGDSTPVWSGLNDRYVLLYLDDEESVTVGLDRGIIF